MPQTPKSFQQVLQELWELLKAYAQQETVGPLKNLQRQVGFGLAGTFCFALGWFLITLGIMRLFQTHELPLVGSWFMDNTWANYLIACLILVAVCAWAGLKAKGRGKPGIVVPADTGSPGSSESSGSAPGAPDPNIPAAVAAGAIDTTEVNEEPAP